MSESFTYGSVRGAAGKGGPYRDSIAMLSTSASANIAGHGMAFTVLTGGAGGLTGIKGASQN